MKNLQDLRGSLNLDLKRNLAQDYKAQKLKKEIAKLLEIIKQSAQESLQKELQIQSGLTTYSQSKLKSQILTQNHNLLSEKLGILKEKLKIQDAQNKAQEFENLQVLFTQKEYTRKLEIKTRELENLLEQKATLKAQCLSLKGRIYLKDLLFFLELCGITQAKLNLQVLKLMQILSQARGQKAEFLRDLRKRLEVEILKLTQELHALLKNKEALEAEVFTLFEKIESTKAEIAKCKENLESLKELREKKELEFQPFKEEILRLEAEAKEQEEKVLYLLERLKNVQDEIKEAQKRKLELHDYFYKIFGKITLQEGKLERICSEVMTFKEFTARRENEWNFW